MDISVLFVWLIWVVVILKLSAHLRRRLEHAILEILLRAEGAVYPKHAAYVLLKTYHLQISEAFLVMILRDFVLRGWATSQEFIAGDCRVEGFALTDKGRQAYARQRG